MEWIEIGGAPTPTVKPQRHRRIGGSEIGVLMGQGSFSTTPQDVYMRIVHGISNFTGNIYTERGQKYEPILREHYINNAGATVETHPGIMLYDICFACSFDDIAVRDGVRFPVDYKTASNSVGNLRKWAKGIPTQYRAQLALYMACMDAPFSELYVAFGTDIKDENGNPTGEFDITEYKPFRLERDLVYEKQVIETGRQFWFNHIVPQVPPEKIAVPEKISIPSRIGFDVYVATVAKHIATEHKVTDLRAANDGPLGFGKWKGVLSSYVRENPPPPGEYVVFSGGDLTDTVVEALRPIAATNGVRLFINCIPTPDGYVVGIR